MQTKAATATGRDALKHTKPSDVAKALRHCRLDVEINTVQHKGISVQSPAFFKVLNLVEISFPRLPSAADFAEMLVAAFSLTLASEASWLKPSFQDALSIPR